MAKRSESARGAPLLQAIVEKLAGPDSPIGEVRPLDAAQLRAVEERAGVALSPALHALLSYDAGWIGREFGWFDDDGRFLARPMLDIVEEHAGPFAEAYEDLCAMRFSGKALPLDRGSDSMRILYFGDPDEQGEYPVLFIDHDDVPMLGVESAGFDLWLAEHLGIAFRATSKLVAQASRRILGGKEPWTMEDFDRELPPPAPGPKPGSVAFAKLTVPNARPQKLTDKQLTKALAEHAERGNDVRLAKLLADAKSRHLPAKAFDDALVAAAKGKRASTVRLVLEHGADPNAREYYGCALSRLIVYGGGVDAVRVLLDAGADPNGPSVNGETALFDAIEHASLDVTRLLLERGADPNRCDQYGRTALVEAASEATDPDVIDALVDHGAAVDGIGDGPSPLAAAVERRAHDIARRLLARGADVNRRAKYLRATPLHVAFEIADDEMAIELVRAGADRTIADERGIALDGVYGPNGEDVRPLDVHYIPSEEAQTLTVHARLAVLNAAAMPYMYHPPLHPPHWAELIENGLAAGGAFDPVKSRATVVETFDRASIRQAGFVDAKFQLSIAAVAPEFLRLMARQLLGSAMSRSGAGVSAAVRTVGLSIRGGLDGPSVVDATRLRAWIDDPTVQIAAFEGAAPFEFRVEQGEAWSLLVVPEKKLSTSVRDTIHTVARAWLSLSPMWPRSSDDPATSHVMAAPNLLEEQGARFDVIAPAAAKNERTRFPFAAAPAEAALRNAMRSLHARLPLRLAVLTRPPHESRGRVE